MSRNAVTIAGLLLFALCLACAAQSPVQFGFGSSDLAPVKFGGKKLPSWLSSEWSPIFNGVNQYVQVASASATNLPYGSSARTIMFWLKKYGTPAAGSLYPLAYGDNTTTLKQLAFFVTATTAGTAISTGGNSSFSRSEDYGWHHYAYTLPEGGSIGSQTMYYDGVPKSLTHAAPQSQVINTTNVSGLVLGSVAAAPPPAGYLFNGSLAEVVFFNRVLSASEIQRYYTKRLKGTESGLVAYYPLNDNAQVLVDRVGGKNAVASNSITWTRRNGYAAPDVRSERFCLSFDGVDDHGIASQNFQLTGNYSMGGWFFLDPSTTAGPMVAVGSATGAGGNEIGFSPISGYVTLYTRGGNASSSQRFDAAWHHLFMVASGTNPLLGSITFYIDGIATSTKSDYPAAINISQPNGQIAFGRRIYLPSYRKGKQADFTIWNRVLSQSEIQTLMYSMPATNSSGLIYYAKQNEGTGTSVADSTASAATMTLFNTPTWVGRDIP